ncbi:MAG: hypothetical protein WCF67_00530 [Chitinophagaceae bacterium]
MKNFLSIIFFSAACLLSACAQTKTGIQNTYAYFSISFPGNIPVDENGNPLKGPDTMRVIYIETSGKAKPVIKSVQYGNVEFSAAVFAEEKYPVAIGKAQTSNQNIMLSPRKGNTLWRVELASLRALPSKSKSIIVKGTLNGRAFTRTILKEQELAPQIRA